MLSGVPAKNFMYKEQFHKALVVPMNIGGKCQILTQMNLKHAFSLKEKGLRAS